MFRELPKELFVSRLLLEYSSNETKLDNAWVVLLEKLKEEDDFPYRLQCELKRRLHTRTGETVSVKLAYDIHALVSVTEGAKYTDIKDLLSTGRNQKSQSMSNTPNRNLRSHDDTYEIKSVLQDIASLRVEILNIKQTQVGTEQLRANQIKTLKSSIASLKSDMIELISSVTNYLTEIKLAVERIESDKCSGVVQLKTEVRTLKYTVTRDPWATTRSPE